jgi:hypothetical protein
MRYNPSMRRHAFSILAALSLLISLATLGQWAQSFRVKYEAQYLRESGGRFRFWSARGRLMFWFQHYDWRKRPDIPRSDLGVIKVSREPAPFSLSAEAYPAWNFLGFSYAWTNPFPPDRLGYHVFLIPHWFLSLLCLMPPAFWCRARLATRRPPAANCCAVCRYDLRAHKPGDKCPECGTLVPSPPPGSPPQEPTTP